MNTLKNGSYFPQGFLNPQEEARLDFTIYGAAIKMDEYPVISDRYDLFF